MGPGTRWSGPHRYKDHSLSCDHLATILCFYNLHFSLEILNFYPFSYLLFNYCFRVNVNKMAEFDTSSDEDDFENVPPVEPLRKDEDQKQFIQI